MALVEERERLFKLLKEVPFLNPYPSHSNFILSEVTSGVDAKKLKVQTCFLITTFFYRRNCSHLKTLGFIDDLCFLLQIMEICPK